MARIPLPERGQPIDVAYLYTIANAVNDLSTQIVSTSDKNITVDTPGYGTGKKSVMPSGAKVVGGYIEIAKQSTVTAGNERTFAYDFLPGFKYNPVVVATPVNIDNTAAGKDVSVILKSISTSRVEGTVKFNASGEVSIAVNFIAIGIPINSDS